jgi:adenylosuccinate synthase
MKGNIVSHHVAVIGAGFGDEGKGQMVDYFARTGNFSYVVRYNGGGQAGHTVVTEDGKRHVFSQLGSGSFRDIPTHLSRFFLFNPIYFMEERRVFTALHGGAPKVTISASAEIVIPLDVIANRQSETERGHTRHGSCGHGIFQAQQRAMYPRMSLWVGRARKMKDHEILKFLEDAHRKFPQYGTALELDVANRVFLENLRAALDCVKVMDDDDILRCHHSIFEGAQGLLLDKDSGFFPHVTPSHTGLTNVVSLIAGSGDGSVNPYYVTRTYLTRHGEGPLYHGWANPSVATEQWQADKLGKLAEDATNVHNQWQGHLRRGPLSTRQMEFAIRKDWWAAEKMGGPCFISEPQLAVTWCNYNPYCVEGPRVMDALRDGMHFADGPITISFQAHGPTADDVSTK